MRSGRRVPSRRTTCQSPAVSSKHEDGGEVEVEQAPEAADGGVEHVVEVERGRQGLGDPVQREEQGVGVGQAAEAVEGEGVLAVGLAGDPPGVAGDEGHQQQHQAPLGRLAR